MKTALMIILFLVSVLFAVDRASGQGSGNKSPLSFVDLTDDFDRVWAETKDIARDRRVEEFETEFGKILPGFYSADRVKDFITPEHYHDMILKGLEDYPSRRDAIRRVSAQFTKLITPARREFESYFGVMRGYPPIYLVVSFGEFDGGTRDLADGSHLLFGADVIDHIYKDKPIKPFVEHELFHLMHHRTFPDSGSVWSNLWEEGLATYVAAKLNPGVDDAALGLSLPQPIRPAVEAKRNDAICAVRWVLDSEKPADYASLFYGNQSIPGFPPRMGYYVGYLVVQEVGRTRTLKQLAALKPEQVKPLIERTIENMVPCSHVP
jgi:hypothetical protein